MNDSRGAAVTGTMPAPDPAASSHTDAAPAPSAPVLLPLPAVKGDVALAGRGMPVLLMVKTVCYRVDGLKPIDELLAA